MVFRKPCKTQVFDDIMEFENDETISPAVINIDGSRVPIVRNLLKKQTIRKPSTIQIHNSKIGGSLTDKYANMAFPSQMLIHSDSLDHLKKQGGDHSILDKVGYEDDEIDIIIGCSKASKNEREEGLEDFEVQTKKGFNTSPRGYDGEIHDETFRKNIHPTVKPISLNERVFKRFMLPKACNQKVVILFAGVASEFVGVLKNGLREDQIFGVELDPYFTRIAQTRIKYYNKKFNKQKRLF